MTIHPSIDPRHSSGISRRSILQGGIATLAVAFTASLSNREAMAATGSAYVGAYIKISSDGTVTVLIGSTEMGQGILSGLAQVVAEELMVDWSVVRSDHAPAGASYANPMFHAQLTGGSTSMRGWYAPLRKAAAAAREMLVTAGAGVLGQNVSACRAENGKVWCGTSLSVPYSEIVAQAALLTPPTNPTLVSTCRLIGKRVQRTDIPSKVDGSAVFGIDIRLPDMVYAAIQHCPQFGGTVKTMPTKPASALAVVNLGNAVGVVASNTWQAFRLARSLNVGWNVPASSMNATSGTIWSSAKLLLASGTAQVPEVSGQPDTALSSAVRKIDATYQLPYLAHGCMEVLNCTVSLTPTSCEIWAPTQGQVMVLATVKSLLPALTDSQITIHTTLLGGGLGRKIEQDFISQAIKIAIAVNKPVKLTWSREQDFANDRYRPFALINVKAGLDGENGLISMIYRNVGPSLKAQKQPGNLTNDTGALEGALNLPYTIPNRRVEFVPHPAAVPLGYWRSVGNSINVFGIESAIDELALSASLDPMAFRRTLLASNARGLAVLNAVARLSNWSTQPVAGRARGVAFAIGFGSICAQVVEISVPKVGSIKVHRVSCAIDCGTVVNPDSVEAQMQGGIAHGLSAALWGEVTFKAGTASVSNFSEYRMLRLAEMPVIGVSIVKSGASVGGVGETAVPLIAPALANAYATLTGTRIRTLPFFAGATMGEGEDNESDD
jgi:isoquinoline 1-oxidoreductase beta subunit